MITQEKIQKVGVNLFGIRQKTVLCRIDTIKNRFYNVIIEPITAAQEKEINQSKTLLGAIRFTKEDGSIIECKDIYLYGKVDFNNQEDLDLIEQFNLVDHDGNFIYSTFNYKTGNFTLVNKRVKWYQTWNAIKWFMYCYTLIGKPERVIVYKDSLNAHGFKFR